MAPESVAWIPPFPNLFARAAATFAAWPAEVDALRAVCDRTDALRKRAPTDPGVELGEFEANNRKGQFTRRIAWACYQVDQRFGLRRKPSGAHATRPVDGLLHATDVLMWRPTGHIIDVMSDRDVSWLTEEANTQPTDEWERPLPEVGDVLPLPYQTDPPAPPPIVDVPPAPPLDAAELRAVWTAINAIRDQVRGLPAPAPDFTEVLARLETAIGDPARLARKGDPVRVVVSMRGISAAISG